MLEVFSYFKNSKFGLKNAKYKTLRCRHLFFLCQNKMFFKFRFIFVLICFVHSELFWGEGGRGGGQEEVSCHLKRKKWMRRWRIICSCYFYFYFSSFWHEINFHLLCSLIFNSFRFQSKLSLVMFSDLSLIHFDFKLIVNLT